MDFLRRLTGILGGQGSQDGRKDGLLGFTNAPEVGDLPTGTEAQRVIQQICREALNAKQGWQAKLGDSPRWAALKNDSEALQIAVMLAAVSPSKRGGISYAGDSWNVEELRKNIVSQLLRRPLPLTSAQLHSLLQAWEGQHYPLDYGLPGRAMLGAVERHVEREPLDASLIKILTRIRRRASGNGGRQNKTLQQIIDRIGSLLDPSGQPASEVRLPAGAFATSFAAWAQSLPADEAAKWKELAQLAADSGDKSKPTAKWLGQAKPMAEAIGPAALTAQIAKWFDEVLPDPARPDTSLDILKGIVWLSTFLDHGDMAGQVGRFAEKCFRKVPEFGARSVKLGNASLWALAEMAGEPRAAAELFRLKERIKYPSARKMIESKLGELSAKTGQSVEAMEDVSLPDFGLDEHSAMIATFGEARADLQLLATETVQTWFAAGGKPVKSIPAEVRTGHAGALAAFKLAAKEIEAARAAQVLRLEQSWIEERSWQFAAWQENFLRHPLRRPIVDALIWRIGERVLMPVASALQDVTGQVHEPGPDEIVRLWHPLDSLPDDVLAWRQRILDLGITQPIKQAHREIYVLTDAERQTEIYSNRFAAHILRQHQFRALCQARGWKYDLMGGWDGFNSPTRVLPAQGLQVEYLVEIVDDGNQSASGVSMHLASDQVRFIDANRDSVELERIAPVVLSEVLRDVDLFVAVASVANDPNWSDGGPDGRHGNYWREWAFGDLGQSAATRKELIRWIAPKLSISAKLEIGDKSLIVQGKRQKYAIHFGSSNIQILPSNRYLCIVPDREPAETARIKLPFAGDGQLSTILAKAFMLVDEDKIRDPTILRQL